ncbi:MAG: chromosome segregation ATPase [Flavobacterium sp.]|jgi:chromosome segregation ATPase
MSGLTELIDSLEVKFSKMYHKMDTLEKKNQELSDELIQFKDNNNKQLKTIGDLQNQLESLKTVNAILGSDENKRETKLKINSLIREIDYCIAQLSE